MDRAICRMHGIYNVEYMQMNGVQEFLEGLEKLAFFWLLNVCPNSRSFVILCVHWSSGCMCTQTYILF